MTDRPKDGHYYAMDQYVFRAPLQSSTGVTTGFLVCTCAEHIAGAAEEIADALNVAKNRHRIAELEKKT